MYKTVPLVERGMANNPDLDNIPHNNANKNQQKHFSTGFKQNRCNMVK